MTSPTPSGRLLSLDWLRGLVMALMALDHTSMFLHKGRFSRDTVLHYHGEAIILSEFLTRWITHLCAPTFAFTVGVGVALRVIRGIERDESPAAIDRYLLTRGTLLIALDLTLFSMSSGRLILQVLYALGFGMIAMVILRRLRLGWCLALALGWFACGEAITMLLWSPASGNAPLWLAPLLGVNTTAKTVIIYPAIHWLAIILLGWCFGHYLHQHRAQLQRPIRLLLAGSGIGIALFVALRLFNGYGNMLMYRQTDATNHPIVQWLLVSKYPPSLSYIALEIGIMAAILAGVIYLSTKVTLRRNGPIITFGQTALFFYLLHFLILVVTASQIPPKPLLLPGTYLVALALLILLYPICRWYRGYKARHPKSFVRFI